MKHYILMGAGSSIARDFMTRLDESYMVTAMTRDASLINVSDYECNLRIAEINPHSFDEVAECIAETSDSQHVDGVVNFCGNIVLKPMHLTSYDLFKQTIDINLMTSFNLAHAVTTYIKKDCHLIFISTSAAHIGLPNHEAITAAKSAVEGLSMSLAASYAKANLRCNVIAPGLIETPLSENITSSEKARSFSQAMHGLSRLGKPQDISSLLFWMLSDDCQWMTGEVIRLDGGLSTMKC